ncbi:MAG: hypothetical protein IPP69_04900 [Flavobacteriales bacterium]|nr:hypothetical protein [Flavobacteriales bacterium]
MKIIKPLIGSVVILCFCLLAKRSFAQSYTTNCHFTLVGNVYDCHAEFISVKLYPDDAFGSEFQYWSIDSDHPEDLLYWWGNVPIGEVFFLQGVTGDVVHMYEIYIEPFPDLQISYTGNDCSDLDGQLCIELNEHYSITQVNYWNSPMSNSMPLNTVLCHDLEGSGEYFVEYNMSFVELPGIVSGLDCYIDVPAAGEIEVSIEPIDVGGFCADYSITLSAEINVEGGAFNYLWDNSETTQTVVISGLSTPYVNTSVLVESADFDCEGTALFELDFTDMICPFDLDGDGMVDADDLFVADGLMIQFGQSGSGIPSDFDCDQIVTVEDLILFVGAFGTTCP